MRPFVDPYKVSRDRCPKCRDNEDYVSEGSLSFVWRVVYQPHSYDGFEHLDVICGNCGYSYSMATADAPTEVIP